MMACASSRGLRRARFRGAQRNVARKHHQCCALRRARSTLHGLQGPESAGMRPPHRSAGIGREQTVLERSAFNRRRAIPSLVLSAEGLPSVTAQKSASGPLSRRPADAARGGSGDFSIQWRQKSASARYRASMNSIWRDGSGLARLAMAAGTGGRAGARPGSVRRQILERIDRKVERGPQMVWRHESRMAPSD